MEYRIVFYATEAGEKPMLDFLESLRGRNDVLHKLVTAGLLKLKHRDNHGPPLTAAIRGAPSLYELRVGRTDIARVFFFFVQARKLFAPMDTSRRPRSSIPLRSLGPSGTRPIGSNGIP